MLAAAATACATVCTAAALRPATRSLAVRRGWLGNGRRRRPALGADGRKPADGKRHTAARRRRRGQTLAAAALPDSIDVLVGCLQAGQTPLLALHELARRAPQATRAAWQAAADRLQRGDGFADAITELVPHCGSTAMPIVAALSSGVRDGLPLLPLLDRLTIEADARRRRLAEAEARKLPVRLAFPLVCCTLPAFVLLGIVPALLGALSDLQLAT